ncbi:MAG: purine-nucleoside phosphorylase [candidate division WOR-3 bacterium]
MRLERVLKITDFLKGEGIDNIQIGIILGSGIKEIVENFNIRKEISYSEIPDFPISTAPGHEGKLKFSSFAGKNILFFCGRFHYYEGYKMDDIVLPVYLTKFLSGEILVTTNAAGGLNPLFSKGDIMRIVDHINLFPENPLRGKNDEKIGERFPSMIDAYDPYLGEIFDKVAEEEGISLKRGIYVGWQGPSLETKAEYKFLRIIGADAVGMSTTPEVIIARYLGLKVLGISIITNMGIGDITPHSPEEIIEVARNSSKILGKLLLKWIERL